MGSEMCIRDRAIIAFVALLPKGIIGIAARIAPAAAKPAKGAAA